jgi:hypothetical protein
MINNDDGLSKWFVEVDICDIVDIACLFQHTTIVNAFLYLKHSPYYHTNKNPYNKDNINIHFYRGYPNAYVNSTKNT